MNAECRLLNRFQGGQFNQPVFADMLAWKIFMFAGILRTLNLYKSLQKLDHTRVGLALQKHVYVFKYTFTTKKWKFSDKKFWYFPYFCSKHR